MKCRLALLVVIATFLAAAGGVPQASATPAATWYWTSGYCKSTLHKYGVLFNDGRTFNISQAYCMGAGGTRTCSWSNDYTTRQYSRFYVFARSYDGTVRSFTLTTSGRLGFRATSFRAFRKYTLEGFIALALPYAADVARDEQEKGCGAA